MGKRKSSAKAPAKAPRPKLETTFACPFCNAGAPPPAAPPRTAARHHAHHLPLPSLPPAAEKAVHCEMDRDLMVGEVKCTACGERWSNKIHDLSEAIDVYSEWIDACEAANAE